MRIFVIKTDTDLQGLSQQLLRRPDAASTTLDKLTALNPQLDVNRLKVGDVLLVPEAPDLKAGAGSAVGSEDLKSLVDEIDAGVAAVAQRVRAGFERLDADRTAVAAAMKSAPSRRVVESDPELQKQLQAADAQFKADQKSSADAVKQIAEVQKLATEELARLQRMLG